MASIRLHCHNNNESLFDQKIKTRILCYNINQYLKISLFENTFMKRVVRTSGFTTVSLLKLSLVSLISGNRLYI